MNARYGYLNQPDGYSDVAGCWVRAKCLLCGEEVDAIREECDVKDSKLAIDDCGCELLKEHANG